MPCGANLDEIMNERRNKHGVEFDVHVLEDVIEGPLGAVLGDQSDAVQVSGHLHTGSDERVDVVVPQLPHCLHLLHHLPADVFLPVELELRDPDGAPVVPGSLAVVMTQPGVSWK